MSNLSKSTKPNLLATVRLSDVSPKKAVPAIQEQVVEVLHFFMLDIADRIKAIRLNTISEHNQIISDFLDKISDSPTPSADFQALGIDDFSEFVMFLDAAQSNIFQEFNTVGSYSADSFNLLAESLGETAAYLNDTLETVIASPAKLAAIQAYMGETVSEPEPIVSNHADLLSEISSSSAKSIPFSSEAKGDDEFSLADFFAEGPDDTVETSSLERHSGTAHSDLPEAKKPDDSLSAFSSETSPATAAKTVSVSQFFQVLADKIEHLVTAEKKPAVIAQTFRRFSTVFDPISELKPFSTIEGISDFIGFLQEIKSNVPPDRLQNITDEAATALISMFEAGLRNPETKAIINRYANLSGESDVDENLGLLDNFKIEPDADVEPSLNPNILSELTSNIDDLSSASLTQFVRKTFEQIRSRSAAFSHADSIAHLATSILSAPDTIQAVKYHGDIPSLKGFYEEFIVTLEKSGTSQKELDAQLEPVVQMLLESINEYFSADSPTPVTPAVPLPTEPLATPIEEAPADTAGTFFDLTEDGSPLIEESSGIAEPIALPEASGLLTDEPMLTEDDGLLADDDASLFSGTSLAEEKSLTSPDFLMQVPASAVPEIPPIVDESLLDDTLSLDRSDEVLMPPPAASTENVQSPSKPETPPLNEEMIAVPTATEELGLLDSASGSDFDILNDSPVEELAESAPVVPTVAASPATPPAVPVDDELLLTEEGLLDDSLMDVPQASNASAADMSKDLLQNLGTPSTPPPQDSLGDELLMDELLLDDSASPEPSAKPLDTIASSSSMPPSNKADNLLGDGLLNDTKPELLSFADETQSPAAPVASSSEQLLSFDEEAPLLDDAAAEPLLETPAAPMTAQAATPSASKKKFEPNEIQQIFLEEASEYIEKLNADLIEADKNKGTFVAELVDRILRSSHTLKGSAAMVQLRHISDLGHKMEDVLQVIRDKKIGMQSDLIDVLFKSVDMITAMMGTFRETGLDDIAGVEPLVKTLAGYTEELTTGKKVVQAAAAATQAAATPEQKAQTTDNADQVRKFSEKFISNIAEQTVRIDITTLNTLVNLAGELVISRNRLNTELGGVYNIINKLTKERTQLGSVSKKINTAIQKSTAGKAMQDLTGTPTSVGGGLVGFGTTGNAAGSDILKEFSDTEFDRFSDLDILSKEVKSSILNLEEAIRDIRNLTTTLNQNVGKVSAIANDLNAEIVSMRMVPIKQMYSRFTRSVRDIAKQEGKDINLATEGEDTKLDKTVMEDIIEPVMHIVRNAIGHGVETMDARRALGKDPVGNLSMKAYQAGNQIVIEIEDDGAGMDANKLRASAVRKNIATQEEVDKMTDTEAIELIFRPGFSTAAQITELSGRGVGLDVVRNTIRRLKGNLNIQTAVGKGTKFVISLPLTLSIGQALLVLCNDVTYAIPLDSVYETAEIPKELIERRGDKSFIKIRGEDMELVYLAETLGQSSEQSRMRAKTQLLVLANEAGKKAIAVDKFTGKEEIVIKTLGKHLRNVEGIVGSTILGNGKVVIILDVDSFFKDKTKAAVQYIEIKSAVDEQAVPDVPTAKLRKRKAQKITILAADDSPSVRKYVQSVLQGADMNVVSAEDGLIALNRLEMSNCDMVITDLEMPRMNGFELVSEIRRLPQYADLPVIIVTARAGEKHRRTGLELGASGFLNKPFDPRQLIDLIKSFVA
jgi:chemotaxis protein histidine kinase CheA